MNPTAAVLEGVLIVVDHPLTVSALSSGLDLDETTVSQTLQALAADYEATGRGFQLRETASGWQIFSRPDLHAQIAGFLTAGQTSRLSQAALETLSVIAYQQPVTRARIAAIRGVSVDSVVRTLVLRGLIVEADTEPVSGATTLVTTPAFLASIGIETLADLPEIAPFLPTDDGRQFEGEEFGTIEA